MTELEQLADDSLTEEAAIKLAESEWWNKFPAKDVALAQLRQPRLCMPFSEFHRVVEEAIGSPVQTVSFVWLRVLQRRLQGDDSLIKWIEARP